MNNRLKNLRTRLDEAGIDAVLITQAENRRYLSGFDGTAGYLIITPKQTVLATDFRYTEQARAEAPDFQIQMITGDLGKWLPGLLADLGIKKLSFESGDVTYDFHRRVKQALKRKKSSVKLSPAVGLVEAIRSIKEPEEIEFIAHASAITDAALEAVAPQIKVGMTEKQAAWELEKTLREKGSQSLPFDIIVASGPNAALPHARPTDKTINAGESIVIDMGAKYNGYAADLSRTLCVGQAGAEFKKVYNTVLAAQQKAIELITEGMTGSRADNISRQVIKKAGYGEAFGHALGHGVGLAAHELPRLGSGSKDRLVNGMVFTVEPGIYLTGWGGVRIEDTVVMEKGRVKPLTKARKAVY